MPDRKPLIDDADLPGPKPRKAAGGPSTDKVKLIAAAGGLIVAGLVLAWGLGLFRGKPEPLPDNAERMEQLKAEAAEEAAREERMPGRSIEAGG
jgi:hypothetical protein